jgi:phosphoglycerate dehydrogenase-like enzyme
MSLTPRHDVRAAAPEWAIATIAARAPDAEVVALESADLQTIDFLVPSQVRPELLDLLADLDRVAVVQTLSAGTDWIEDMVPSRATLCSARGARDGPVAEWIVGALLGVSARLLEFARRREWDEGLEIDDLESWTVLIVGMGSIGRRVAELLAPFRSRVVGVASHARDDLHGIDELGKLLPDADAVVVLTPLTDATRGLIGAAELAALHDGAVVVNAARGPVVEREALLTEVSSGRLRAVLDVTDPEPLPADDPLWTAPGVLGITPHFAGGSPLADQRAAELAGDQLARWCAGEQLLNVMRAGSSGAGG